MKNLSEDMGESPKTMTLQAWRKRLGITQAQVVAQLERLAPAVFGEALIVKVDQSAISRIEGGAKPRRELMILLNVLSLGRVDANALYELPDWREFKHALAVLPDADPPAGPSTDSDEGGAA